MNKQTLKALKGSIEKWERIVAGGGIDEQVNNCPLCKIFYGKGQKHCVSCPVFLETGKKYCNDSPYMDWANHQDDWHHFPEFKRRVICATCRRLAKAELAFLKSLLPKSEK